jgi:hypothetical protein
LIYCNISYSLVKKKQNSFCFAFSGVMKLQLFFEQCYSKPVNPYQVYMFIVILFLVPLSELSIIYTIVTMFYLLTVKYSF